MKKHNCFIVLSLLAALLVMMSACGNSNDSEKSGQKKKESDDVSVKEDRTISADRSRTASAKDSASDSETNGKQESEAQSKSEKKETEKDVVLEEEKTNDSEATKPLSEYGAKQIEYARVWLQLGENKDTDGLYARHIPAGTPLNPDDETSATYPEEVIQLAGDRLIDGSITYSGNGDGTINIYNVPLRWDGHYPAGKKFYKDIIDKTQSVYINPGNDEEVIEMIKRIKVQ